MKELISIDGRLLVLDTETTGFDAKGEDRVIEIGIVEVIDRKPTGKVFHVYINPERDVPEEAYAVHGLSRDDLMELSGGKVYGDIADDLLEFIGEDTIVAHNAGFDMDFINAEQKRCGKKTFEELGNPVVCTYKLANTKYVGQANSLDALCKRLIGAENYARDLHGALLDASLLAQVFRIMTIQQDGIQFENKPLVTRGALKPERLTIPSGSLQLASVSLEDRQSNEKMRQRIEKTSGGKYPSFGPGI